MSRRNSAVAAGIAPMPELQRRPVRHQLGDVGADPALDLPDVADGPLVRRNVDLDREVDVVHVDEAVAEGSRHRPIELRR